MRKNFGFLLLVGSVAVLSYRAQSATLHVGSGQPYASLSQAIAAVQPGDTILVHQGIYNGGVSAQNLQGTAANWIYIHAAPGQTVTYNGGTNAWQFSDGAYLHIKGFTYQQQTGNGLNMDDGGTYATPAHHLVFDSCTFKDINATGNNDLLKMSGVDTFEIRNCTFLNGSIGSGDAIDMVGCHEGLIKNCRFENMGAASVQAKGGCKNIRIEANFFKNGGQRSLNLGGSTGLQFFRPIDAKYEASDLKVYSNIFIGSDAPIAYVGCINTEVVNNTIYLPKKWVLRILQETVDTSRFYPCGNNTFRNNIIYHDNQVTTDCNIGPNTNPASFTFSNDLWFHSQNASWAGPSSLPVQDVNRIVGQNPMFVNASAENFALLAGSPAIGNGFGVSQPQQDYTGKNFLLPRSIGAFEGALGTEVPEFTGIPDLRVFPNPVCGPSFFLCTKDDQDAEVELIDAGGRKVYSSASQKGISEEREVTVPAGLPAGMYWIRVRSKNSLTAVGTILLLNPSK